MRTWPFLATKLADYILIIRISSESWDEIPHKNMEAKCHVSLLGHFLEGRQNDSPAGLSPIMSTGSLGVLTPALNCLPPGFLYANLCKYLGAFYSLQLVLCLMFLFSLKSSGRRRGGRDESPQGSRRGLHSQKMHPMARRPGSEWREILRKTWRGLMS